MATSKAESSKTDKAAHKRLKTGNLRVDIDRVQPNPWNPNKMEPALYAKLITGLKRTLEETGKLPPIIVRPNKGKGVYEIIDGEHRWRALKELKETKIRVVSFECTDQLARMLTINLNYLRGTADDEQLGKNVMDLIELGCSTVDLAEILPYSEYDIATMVEESKVSLKAYENLLRQDDDDSGGSGGGKTDDEDDIWVNLNYRVTKPQSEIVQREITRISTRLKGKNLQGRSLELMAVLSSQSPLEDVDHAPTSTNK